jgi:hypothetical protein
VFVNRELLVKGLKLAIVQNSSLIMEWIWIYSFCQFIPCSAADRNQNHAVWSNIHVMIGEFGEKGFYSKGFHRTGNKTKQNFSPRFMLKELNPRPRFYVEIPKPSRVELKCCQNPRRDVILVTPEKVLVSQHEYKDPTPRV